MTQSIGLNSQNEYEIRIYGQADGSWLGWFEKAEVHAAAREDGTWVTTFSHIVMDQAGLVGLVRHLHGLGVVLLSVREVRGG
jgi:hypothetical protein